MNKTLASCRNRGGNAARCAPEAFAFGARFWYNCIVKFAERFVAALFLALVGSAFADGEATSTTTVTVDTTETGAKFYKAEIK